MSSGNQHGCARVAHGSMMGFRAPAVASDWVEHALATDAAPYLRTPEEELSFIVRHNLDVNVAAAIAACAMLALLLQALRAASRLLFRSSQKLKRS